MTRLYTVWQIFARELEYHVLKRRDTISSLFHVVAETPEDAARIVACLPSWMAAKVITETSTTVVEDEERKEI